jgi:hypothetical protein
VNRRTNRVRQRTGSGHVARHGQFVGASFLAPTFGRSCNRAWSSAAHSGAGQAAPPHSARGFAVRWPLGALAQRFARFPVHIPAGAPAQLFARVGPVRVVRGAGGPLARYLAGLAVIRPVGPLARCIAGFARRPLDPHARCVGGPAALAARPRAAAVLAASVAALAALALALTAAPASADRSFAQRFATTDHGQVLTAANTVLMCSGSGSACRAAQNGTSADDNNDFTMDYVDVDSDSATFNSSRSTLALPSGATVLFAGLYWAGDTSAGDGGDVAPFAGARAFVRFATPTAATYRVVSASVLDTDATSTTRYQAFADVTSLVAAAGNGVYTVGNVETGTGADRYGGWGLVVVYRHPSEPTRRLLVYDGLLALQSGLRPTADVALSGFVTPPSGTVLGRLALLAWEGDRGITGDAATFANRSLVDAANPVQNVFNSSVSRAGTATTGRTPSYVGTLGVDSDEPTVDGFLANGSSSATLHLSTVTDVYLPGAIGLAIDEGPPLNQAAPTVSGTARDAQALTADPGGWQGSAPITYAYQWRRCDAAGANCTNVEGATGQTYALGPADVGSTMRVAAPPRTPPARRPPRRRRARGSRPRRRRSRPRPPSPEPRATGRR